MRFRILLSLGLSVLLLAGALLLQAELTQSADAQSREEGKTGSRKKEDLLALRLGGTQENLSQALLGSASSRKKVSSGKKIAKERVAEKEEGEKPKPLYVRLQPGENVSLLCRLEFGAAGAGKVKSVLELNGWSEAKARKLKIGTWVRLR